MSELEAIVMADETWSAITSEMTANEVSARQQIQVSGQQIISCVAAGRLPVDDLRRCARWTTRLAREAVRAAEQPTAWSEEERLEALARRILHGSVSAALDKVKTDGRLVTERAKQLRRLRRDQPVAMPGMGRLERKDREARDGFAEQL
jgi:hypothetical protein